MVTSTCNPSAGASNAYANAIFDTARLLNNAGFQEHQQRQQHVNQQIHRVQINRIKRIKRWLKKQWMNENFKYSVSPHCNTAYW